MPWKTIVFFVEGDADSRFIERVVEPNLQTSNISVDTYEYENKKKDKVKSFIQRCQAKEVFDYYFLSDFDYNPCMTQAIENELEKRPYLDEEKIIIVVKEIEGWYLAGLSDDASDDLGIPYYEDTQKIYKDQFNNLRPREFDSLIDFQIELTKFFDMDEARGSNESFEYMHNATGLQWRTVPS